MATTIYFNSRVTAIPGSYSEVDASGLAKVGLGATGIVALIGEAEGGEPAVVQPVSNPGKVAKLFRAGDLLEGGNILFDPSKDPDIPGGAQEIMFVKVNPATQSTLTLLEDFGSDAIDLTSRDYGAFTEKISVDVSDGTEVGTKAVQVSFESVTETFDNLGADGVGILEYTGNGYAANASFNPVGGLTASTNNLLIGSGSDRDTAVSVVNPSNLTQDSGAPDTITITTSDVGDVDVVTIYGIDNGTGMFASEDVTLAGVGAVVSTTTWMVVFGVVIPVFALNAPMVITGTVSTDVMANSQQTVGLGTNPQVMTEPYEAVNVGPVHMGSVDPASTDLFLVVGEDETSTPVAEIVQLVAGEAFTVTTWTLIQGVFSSLAVDDMFLRGSLTQPGVAVLWSDNATDTTIAVTIYGADGGGNPQQETIALDATDATVAVTTASSWRYIAGIGLSHDSAGDVTVRIGASIATALRVAVLGPGQLGAGLQPVDAYDVNGANPQWTASDPSFNGLLIGDSGTTLEFISGAAGTTVNPYQQVDVFAGLYDDSGAFVDLYYSPFLLTEGGGFVTFEDWQDFFDQQNQWSLTKTMAATASSYNVSNLDSFTGAECIGGYAIGDILYDIVAALNAGSAFVTAVVASTSTGGIPANTPTARFMTGGTEGVTGFADWQAALDTLRDYRVNTIVALTTDEAVQAATIAHCSYMCAAGRSERDCVLGAPSGTSLSAAKALALSMNTRHARLLIQDVERFSTLGAKEQFAPPFTACVAAGMQAGSDVGTSLTFKYLNILDTFGDDATYTIQDDANSLIQSGLCMIEKVPNRGQRWLRNVTTYLIDNNLAYSEASVNEAVNYSVYSFRTALEAMVGQKGFAGTVTAAQGLSVSILGQLVGVTAITSWRNLTISLTDDVMTVDVEIAPIIPINFIKTTIHLVSATFEATT